MKKIFLVLLCLFMSYEVKSLETMLKCINYEEDEFILYINSKYNYIGELEDFEREKEISKKENKMEITDSQIKIIIPEKIHINDDPSDRQMDAILLNRVDGTLEYTETKNNRVSEKKTIGKCKKHEKLF